MPTTFLRNSTETRERSSQRSFHPRRYVAFSEEPSSESGFAAGTDESMAWLSLSWASATISDRSKASILPIAENESAHYRDGFSAISGAWRRLFREQRVDLAEDSIARLVASAIYPEKWLADKIVPPLPACRKQATKVVLKLYRKNGLIPTRVAASIEEGLAIAYRHSFFTKRTMLVEVYNSGQVVAIVNEDKNILFCDEVEKNSFSAALDAFNG